MGRRTGALALTAPSTSLALVLSILIAAAVALPAHAASGQRTAAGPDAAEAPSAAGAQETAAERRAARQAERAARHEERVAERSPSATETTAGAPAKKEAAAEERAAHKAERAAARAEHSAERAARRGNGAGTSAGSSTRAAVQGRGGGRAANGKGASRLEREERTRAREEHRQQNGHETHKQKLARLSREQREAAEAGQGGAAGRQGLGTASAAADGLAPASTPESRAAATAALAPAIRAERGVRNSGRAGKHTSRRRGAAGTGAREASLLALPAAVRETAGEAAPGRTRSGGATSHHGSSSRAGSPLVTTVTRIIGVIPAALWLLIGALALAACAFALTTRLTARRARKLERQRRELLEDVGLLQAALLPELPPRLGAVATTAAYRPASGPGAGGDFYDVFALPEGLVAVLVGDVSGHGREALPHTTLLRYTLRTYLEAGLSPREALRAAAPSLERQLGGSFATVVLATYDPRERLLRYSCAGHPHPLLSGLGADAGILAASAPPIGAGQPTGTRQTVVHVPGGALVAFYTDGVIEARTDGELYGQRRLAGVLEQLSEPAQPTSAAALLDRVAEQTDRRPDDMAACVLEISGEGERPRVLAEEIELDGRDAGSRRARRFLHAAGVSSGEADRALASARAIAADHGSAVLRVDLSGATPRLTLTHDHVAPLRARAMARTQEVAL